jgi:hypothetical protein
MEIDEFEDEYPMRERMRRLENFDPVRGGPTAEVFRRIMTHVGYWRQCHRPQCRRARKCTGPRGDCGWLKLPYLQKTVLPVVFELAKKRLAELEAQEEAGRADDKLPHPEEAPKGPSRRRREPTRRAASSPSPFETRPAAAPQDEGSGSWLQAGADLPLAPPSPISRPAPVSDTPGGKGASSRITLSEKSQSFQGYAINPKD